MKDNSFPGVKKSKILSKVLVTFPETKEGVDNAQQTVTNLLGHSDCHDHRNGVQDPQPIVVDNWAHPEDMEEACTETEHLQHSIDQVAKNLPTLAGIR